MNKEQTQHILDQRKHTIEQFLQNCFSSTNTPEILQKAIYYSLLAGGKRLRPILCMTTAEMFGLPEHVVLPFAAGIEMVHTYSLIHDDLPCMDNDDLRRGKPSSHKAFNEAIAVLTGDALLTEAFVFMSSLNTEKIPSDRILYSLNEVAKASGASGMVGGQIMDIDNINHKNPPISTLYETYQRKTSALIAASCVTGAILAGAKDSHIDALRTYGKSLGTAFQIIDDILDETAETTQIGKPAKSDKNIGKTTYSTLLGIPKSMQYVENEITTALDSIAEFTDTNALFLRMLAHVLTERKH